MKEIVKHLTVTRLEVQHSLEGRYLLGLAEPETWSRAESTLTLTAKDMIRFNLDPSEELVGGKLELTLKAIPYAREIRSPDVVLITRLVRSTEVQPLYAVIPPKKSERRTFRLEARTPVSGGTLAILPPTYYDLNLALTEEEYHRLRELPADMALEVRLRHIKRHFRDVVLTYRGTLDDPRIFPEDYVSRMIPLIRAMIAYFDGDVDVVGHYCGLDVEEERERADNDLPLGTWTRRRDYFAVDPLSPDDWKEAFADRVAQIDAILSERYGNRLPMGTVQEFYDTIETSAWESEKPHPVEELAVGLQAKYVFLERYHLPSIVVQARSVDGNRKACQEACEMLSQEAATLFGVRFDHLSLAVEGSREGAEEPDQLGEEMLS